MLILYLKDDNNNPICDTSVYIKKSNYTIGIKSNVNILFYSKRLLEFNNKKLQRRFIEDINEVIEIHDWYTEYFIDSDKLKEFNTIEDKLRIVEDELKEIYENMATKYGLQFEYKINKNKDK